MKRYKDEFGREVKVYEKDEKNAWKRRMDLHIRLGDRIAAGRKFGKLFITVLKEA